MIRFILTNLILPASILAGTVIGAGMFSLPFVFNQAGFLTGLFYLAAFSLFYIWIYFLYAEVILNTGGEHRFAGYAKIYLGNLGFWTALILGLLELFFVLTVYLILSPSFFNLIYPGNSFYYLLFFWLLGSAATLFNTKKIALLEFLIVAGMLVIIALVGWLGIGKFSFLELSFKNLNFYGWTAVGPILFALSGALVVPEVVNYFRGAKINPFSLKSSLALGGILPVIAYLIFVVGILGLSPVVSEDAVSGLIGSTPGVILVLLGFLGFFSLISSYITIGLNAGRILEYDLAISRNWSKFIVIFLPITLYFLGLQNFIQAVTLVGLIFLPLEIIFIVLMWLKVRYYDSKRLRDL